MADHSEARARAIALAAETMGELVEFWGFKASMGRIWTTLYLSSVPLPADEIAARTSLSAGAVSMALSELIQWGVADREPMVGERKRYYRANTDVWDIVRRIFRERELRLIARANQRFDRAITLLEATQAEHPDDETAFVLERLQLLLKLSRIGYRLVEKLAEVGQLSLKPIRGTLSRLLDA